MITAAAGPGSVIIQNAHPIAGAGAVITSAASPASGEAVVYGSSARQLPLELDARGRSVRPGWFANNQASRGNGRPWQDSAAEAR